MKRLFDVRCMLECGHVVKEHSEPMPKSGDRLYCWTHQAEYAVTRLVSEWYTDCASCPYGRQFGEDKYAALRAATRHERKYIGHTVRVEHGVVNGNPDTVLRRRTEISAGMLPFGVDNPPF